MKSAFFTLLCILAAQSTHAFANEIVLSPGSSAIVRASQETLVSCDGYNGGHNGGRRDRCECVSEGQSCAYGYQNRYVLKVDGIIVKDTSCRSSPAEAGQECMQAKSAYPGCR